jgi:cytochrome c oxidase subunit III
LATTSRPITPAAGQAHGHDAAHDDHAHAHGPELRHHFETAQQQKEAATLGMWAFLVTEVMLFGGIFMAYFVYRWAFPDVWAESASHLNTPLGTVNTVVLLVSSLTVALAVNAAEEGRRRTVLTMLGVTLVLGFGFLGIKAYEYSEKFSHCAGYSTPIAWFTGTGQHAVDECLVPGRAFLFPAEHGGGHGATSEAPNTEGAVQAEPTGHSQAAVVGGQRTPHQLFYFLYFVATGLHAVHMLIGITIVSILAFLTWRGTFTPTYFTPVEIGGLYWHLIDIVWVFLFPLFYLVH